MTPHETTTKTFFLLREPFVRILQEPNADDVVGESLLDRMIRLGDVSPARLADVATEYPHLVPQE